MIWPFKSSGFTLIELMVVLIIVSLLASLVGPVIFKRIEKVKISAEEKKLESIFESAKIISFTRKAPLFIKLENNVLIVMNDVMKEMDATEFKFIAFENSLVHFNANGFSETKKIKYMCDHGEKNLFLKQ